MSSNSFAYWLFHAITFSRKVFSKIHESKSKKSLRETREYRCLLVSTDAEAARAGTDGYTDRQTDRQTHRTTTVTLAHARRGLTNANFYLKAAVNFFAYWFYAHARAAVSIASRRPRARLEKRERACHVVYVPETSFILAVGAQPSIIAGIAMHRNHKC